MSNLCEDLHEINDVKMFVAKKAGSSNTVGTLIHSDFDCSELVLDPPRAIEGHNHPETHIASRIATLSGHAENFAKRLMGTKQTLAEAARRPGGDVSDDKVDPGRSNGQPAHRGDDTQAWYFTWPPTTVSARRVSRIASAWAKSASSDS
nr:FBP domain-containing protein [Brevibacterium sp. FME17]